MDALQQKEEHKNRFEEQLKKLLTIDRYINIFEYQKLIKSEPEAFKARAVLEYQQNEIKVRVLSSRTVTAFVLLGLLFLFLPNWWKCLGAVLLLISSALFFYREGHLKGYVWGHQVGFENGVDRTLCISDALSRAIDEEIMEIEMGSR